MQEKCTPHVKLKIFLVLNLIMVLYLFFGTDVEISYEWVNSIFSNNSKLLRLNADQNSLTSTSIDPVNTRHNYYWILNKKESKIKKH